MFVPLSHAQYGFGEARVIIGGVERIMSSPTFQKSTQPGVRIAYNSMKRAGA